MPDPITYSDFLAANPGSSAATGGVNTSGVLGDILNSLVQTGGQYVVAREVAKGVNAQNTVKSQAQIDAENVQLNRLAVTSSIDTKRIALYGALAVAAIVLVVVLKPKA